MLFYSYLLQCQRTGDWVGARREQASANVVIKQLRTLVKEMDVLRSRVIDSDVHKFDKLINDSRQSALNILQEYIGNFINFEVCNVFKITF